MKNYRELYFKGTPNQLLHFVERIKDYISNDWDMRIETLSGTKYLSFFYYGRKFPRAVVSICIDQNYIDNGMIKVGNIVPLDINQLTLEEYNNILLCFYDEIIKPYKERGTDIKIEGPTDDVFDPLNVISEKALRKLHSFCNLANKSTGSSHPCDKERWHDFICQTVEDGRMFDFDTLAHFLQDEIYWGAKNQTLGCIGKFAWSETKAYELAEEYETACDLLLYYRDKWRS